LATLTDHNGPVNVVRFSSNGRFLASGSDDAMACVYELRSGSGAAVGGLGMESNMENWRVKFALRGHGSHIVDLGWSPEDRYIATASLDATVMIWNVDSGTPVTTLRAHSSFVKGVAWDPIGTYLATQSEDKSVAIWKTDDWSLVTSIKSHFARMVTATFACRLTWSPDGRYLIAGNSYRGATHAAVIIPRERWNEDAKESLLVCGHGGPVVALACSPTLRHVPSPVGGGRDSSGDLSIVFALGSQDRNVTVWSATANRPLGCFSRMFDGQVLDVAWSTDGLTLLAVSSDGKVACMQFDERELGSAATEEEMTEVMQGLYGSRLAGKGGRRKALVESAEQLATETSGQQRQQEPKELHGIMSLDARMGGAGVGQPGGVSQVGFGVGTEQTNRTEMAPPPPIPKTSVEPPLKSSRTAANEAPVVTATKPLLAALPVFDTVRITVQERQELQVINKSTRSGPRAEVAMVPRTSPSPSASLITVQSWKDVVPAMIVAATATPYFCALATSQGLIFLYSAVGRRLAPPLSLGANVAFFDAGGKAKLLVVTTSGELKVFDVLQLRLCIEADVKGLMRTENNEVTVVDVRLVGEGLNSTPVVLLGDGKAYVWHTGMALWTRIVDDAVVNSRFSPLTWFSGSSSAGRLASLQSEAARHARPASHAPSSVTAAQSAADFDIARGIVEGNLAAAQMLQSAEEYKSWLLTYVRMLCQIQDQGRLRELCDELLRPPNESSSLDTVVGLERRKLLREVVLNELRNNGTMGEMYQRCMVALEDVDRVNG
jgi:protein HIRA/HIR1